MRDEVLKIYQYMPAAVLQPVVGRRLIIARGQNEMGLRVVDNRVMKLLAEEGRDQDPLAILRGHGNSVEQFLGLHQQTRRRIRAFIQNTNFSLLEEEPTINNIWVGEDVELLKPEDVGEKIVARGVTDREISGGRRFPEMIVRAANGRLYPATKNDIVVKKPV